MAVSACRAAKHALLLLLRSLAVVYGLTVSPITRDSPDEEVFAFCRRVSRRAHPDKGGSVRDQQQLNDAKETWMKLRGRNTGRPDKPQGDAAQPAALGHDGPPGRAVFRLRGEAAMLTYQGLAGVDLWQEFVEFVKGNLKPWRVKYWTATFEGNRSGKSCHAHLMLQFNTAVDRTSLGFMFGEVRPRIDASDLCGEGLCRKKLQQSINRGHFYVWADKIGTLTDPITNELCVASNYGPSWTDAACKYQVLGAWPDKLWKSHKLSHAVYDMYLLNCRDGVCYRKRNLEVCREKEEEIEKENEIQERSKRIRSNTNLFKSFPEVPEVTGWLANFSVDALRYPILIVLGPSRCGKTEWVKTLFKNPLEVKVGALTYFPDGMRSFRRGFHDAVILDDVRDLSFVTDHQEKLQGKYDAMVEFASTQGGMCAYKKDLFAVPFVVTINFSTKNLGFLEVHDWLANPGNRVLVTLSGAFFQS